MTIHNLIDIRPFRRARRYVSIGSTIGRFMLAFKVARIHRKAIRELESLSDAQLDDIGVPRYSIRDTVESQINGMVRRTEPSDTVRKPEYLQESETIEHPKLAA